MSETATAPASTTAEGSRRPDAPTPGDAIRIRGGNPLDGEIRVGGSKNLGLPVLAAALLTDEPCVFENVPAIEDTRIMLRLISELGATVSPDPLSPTFFDDMTPRRRVKIHAASIRTGDISRHLGKELRASILLVGPLLARHGQVMTVRAGGDDIGARPVDVMLRGFVSLGAILAAGEDDRNLITTDGLIGKTVFLDYPTHTGTENLLMAAVLATGKTTIVNACCEPEVVAFGEMLQKMGADITGLGTPYITIHGVRRLHGVHWLIKPDRLVAGTYAIAAVLTGGNVLIRGVNRGDMLPVVHKLREAGATVTVDDDDGGFLVVQSRAGHTRSDLRPIDIQALPFPGFPTDQQAVIAVLLTQCNGISKLRDRVYEDRLRYLEDLRRMGAKADISPSNGEVSFTGPAKLTGAVVPARDIRAGAAMVLAGMIAEGETTITEAYHLDRGYENLVSTLRGVGANISRVPAPAS
ncbi:MAG TPA: UDP-N-acetylglucosamine 1-carboxyvinyltransferase [Thermomicrobiales bacterium]|jgi:UDP-N-acetylglucosamine 1-carboxyvinyltransferase|nr:UDP-N-acetylglucosamine 1-carboxyvinyltransferase [Thermomicrobiales bacterium]